jgi:hypothetical protein
MAAGDLTTLGNVKQWLGLDTLADNADTDALLARMITAASSFISNYCGRSTFLSSIYTETYDGNGRDFMLLRQWPVTLITSIALTYGSLSAGPSTTITSPSGTPGYMLEAPLPGNSNQRLTLMGAGFPRGRSNVTVIYTAGYQTTPFDVEQVVIELVAERFKAKDRIGEISRSLASTETTTYSTKALNDTSAAMLAPYRRLVPV